MTSKDTIKAIKAASRKLHADMPRGGRQGTPKGKRGYTRKLKHANKGEQKQFCTSTLSKTDTPRDNDM